MTAKTAAYAYAFSLALASYTLPLPAAQVTHDVLGGSLCTTPGGQAGMCSSVPGVHFIDFDDALNDGSPYYSGIATFVFTPDNPSPFVQDSVNGQYAQPGRLTGDARNDLTPYMSIGSPTRTGMVTITFSQPIYYYGFYMGSPDTYNSISFRETVNGPAVNTFTGAQLLAPGGGGQELADYINFRMPGGVRQIVMSSSQAAFETDNHAYATPEPGTALLMGSFGIGLIVIGRWKRRDSSRQL